MAVSSPSWNASIQEPVHSHAALKASALRKLDVDVCVSSTWRMFSLALSNATRPYRLRMDWLPELNDLALDLVPAGSNPVAARVRDLRANGSFGWWTPLKSSTR